MRAPAVSYAKRFAAALMAALLLFALLPANALAEGEGELSGVEEAREGNSTQADKAVGASAEVDDSTSSVVSTEAGTLAASLMERPVSFVNADVTLDGDPVIGSFTVDGLTFAVVDDLTVELVGVSQAVVAGSPPATSETEAESAVFQLLESVIYGNVEYVVTSIGAYAFYLSGVTSVELPASVIDVDDRAFRSSDVASVEVAEGNPNYSSFDGVLYDVEQSSLLLIPEGKQGTVLLPKEAESVSPSVFSHCPLVTQVSVEEGSAAFASENGLLYDASLTTLLRVPAGATDITIREGCTTIAAGAMEACASLAAINAPASVTSISPYLFGRQPETVMAPVAVSAVEDDAGGNPAEDGESSGSAPQITALIALNSTDDDLPEVDPSLISVMILVGADSVVWIERGFEDLSEIDGVLRLSMGVSEASLEAASVYGASYCITLHGNGGRIAGSLIWTTPSNPSVILGTGNWFEIPAASRSGYTFKGYYTAPAGGTQVYYPTNGIARGSNDGTYWKDGNWNYPNNATFYAQWNEGSIYDVVFNGNGGTTSGKVNWTPPHSPITYGQGSWNQVPAAIREGYTFKGFYNASSGGTQVYRPSDTIALCTNEGTYWKNNAWVYPDNITFYAQWGANSYAVEYRDRADTATFSTDNGFVYDTARNLAAKPTSGLSVGYTAVGWATSKNQSSADYGFGTSQKNLATSGTKKLYLAEQPNAYTVTFDAAGGTAASDISATYDKELTLPASTRQGYAFAGWKDEATGTTYQAGNAKNLTAASNATVKLVAQWDPVIAAEVPLDVTAKVDLLGIEEQQQAQAYIRSLCGEPLRVACIELMPLPGARELFGDDVSQVRLEAYAGTDAVPVFSLTIGGTTFLSGGEPLLALKMEGYGDEVPISYRFDIPDELLPSLVEATKPVCQVTYTVERT